MIKLNINRFASGEILLSKVNSSSSVTFQGKLVWSSTANNTANTSTVTVKLYARKQGSSTATSGSGWNGYITVDGTKTTFNTGSLSIKNDWVLVYTAPTKTVNHNNDGTKSITLAGSVKGPSSTTLGSVTSSGSDTATLDRIYRQSSLTSVNVAITTTNGATTVSVTANGTKYVDTYYDTLTLSANNQTITLAGITFGTAATLSAAQKTTLWDMFGSNFSVTISAYVTTKTSSSGTTLGNSNTVNTTTTLPSHTITTTCTYYDAVPAGYLDIYKVNNNDLISNLSSPRYTFSAVSSNGDTYGQTPTFSLTFGSGGDLVSFDEITSPYTIIRDDFDYRLTTPMKLVTSYRNTNTVTNFDNMSIIPYEKPSIWAPSVARLTPTSSTIKLRNLLIEYYDGNGLQHLNNSVGITITYQIGESGTPITVPSSAIVLDHTETVDHMVRDYYNVQFDTGGALDYQETTYVTIEVTDLINVGVTQQRTIPRGIPLWYGYTVNSRAQHMVVKGTLHTQGWLEVENVAEFYEPTYFYSSAMFDKAPRYGAMSAAQDGQGLPDGDLTDTDYWSSVPNGSYYFAYSNGNYTNYPASWGVVEKYGYYTTDGGHNGNINVIFYTQVNGPTYRFSTNQNNTTGTWYRIDGGASIMTLGLSSNQTVSQTGAVKIALSSSLTSGTGLSVSSNGIKIGAGISYVEVSAVMQFSAASGTSLRRCAIYKNSGAIAQANIRPTGTYESVTIPPRLVSVVENDIIYLYLNSDSNSQTVYGNSNQTYLTVKVVR